MANLQFVEETPPSTPVSSSTNTLLHLSGSLHGDTIQVEGDTGSLQFSMQFNIHSKHKHKHHVSGINQCHFMTENVFENNRTLKTTTSSSSSSSYTTPNNTFRVEDQNAQEQARADLLTVDNNRTVETADSNTRNRFGILTRLRSGAISPINYSSPRTSYAMSCESLKTKVKSRGNMDILLRTVLRRHSLPIRPCNSYAFFVMANWSSVKNSSFNEVSKTLGQMWCQISPGEKKVFAGMALKDNMRYKRQCALFKGSRKGQGNKKMQHRRSNR